MFEGFTAEHCVSGNDGSIKCLSFLTFQLDSTFHSFHNEPISLENRLQYRDHTKQCILQHLVLTQQFNSKVSYHKGRFSYEGYRSWAEVRWAELRWDEMGWDEMRWSERDNMSEMASSQRGEIRSKQKEYLSGRNAYCFHQPDLWHDFAAPSFDKPKLKKSPLFASERIWLHSRFHRDSIGGEEMKPIAIMVNARKCDLPTIGE
jgi:hypothetical protein